MESISLGFKDFILIVTTLSTCISIFYALKYKAIRNGEKNEETAHSVKTFKDFVYKELKQIEKQLAELSESMNTMLDKDEAEKKYLPRIEHKLMMDSLNEKMDLILNAVKDRK